jgi:hypothetical protein
LKEGLAPFKPPARHAVRHGTGQHRAVGNRIGADRAQYRRPDKPPAGVARKGRDGDYSQKAETGRLDEIGDFADSFNYMLQGIFERESKILRLRL